MALGDIVQTSQDNYDTMYGGTEVSGYSYDENAIYTIGQSYAAVSGTVAAGSTSGILILWNKLLQYDYVYIRMVTTSGSDNYATSICLPTSVAKAFGSGCIQFYNATTYGAVLITGKVKNYSSSVSMDYYIKAVKL